MEKEPFTPSVPEPGNEPQPQTDPQAHAAARRRHHMLALGLMPLPNLFLRSALTLTLLYGMLGVVLIAVVQFELLGTTVAVALGCTIVVLQFLIGPWMMDLMLRFLYTMSWARPEELPEYLQQFIQRVCDGERMKFPSVGIIEDGAPQAFTYGHHPSNARVVISRGLLRLLTPDEVEAVVAHELGHARNWDMALMTLANLVPLLLYWIYDVAVRFGDRGNKDKGGAWSWAVALGAYVLYIISEYMVLWFSRTREYYADRFAGQVTGKPNALASALVKIAYGLAAADKKEHVTTEAEAGEEKAAAKVESIRATRTTSFAALNIFDRGAAVNMVMCAAHDGEGGGQQQVDVERVKSAMQWDLWNPWATFYELNSTHPLVAKRLLRLSDQASALEQEPYVQFDRAKPESYWDTFLVDLGVLVLPWACLLAGIGLFIGVSIAEGAMQWHMIGAAAILFAVGGFLRNRFTYRGSIFEHRTIATLMGQVKVSPVRPVPAVLTGKIIGKGVPGLIWSEDFVIQDQTGILFLDYKQPLALWDWLFGLLRAGQYQGKEVRVTGWFRRGPTPYLEIFKLDVVDGSLPARTCYSYYANLGGWLLAGLAGCIATAFLI